MGRPTVLASHWREPENSCSVHEAGDLSRPSLSLEAWETSEALPAFSPHLGRLKKFHSQASEGGQRWRWRWRWLWRWLW